MPPLQLRSNLDNGPHVYRSYAPATHLHACLSELAHEYTRLRTEFIVPLNEVPVNGITAMATDALLVRIRTATVPDSSDTRFDVVRSDFGELCAYVILEEEWSTRFGYKAIRDRESINLPARGIDAAGVEDTDPITLVIAEAKVSSEAASPPQVVDSAPDSLRRQHINHLADLPTTIRKVFDLARHARDPETRNLFLKAVLLLDFGELSQVSIVTTCLLVRSEESYSTEDFGSFMRSPNDYAPARIRFLIVTLPCSFAEFEAKWRSAVHAASVIQ